MKTLAKFIFNFSETYYIPLGPCAPFIFEKMIGYKGIKQEKINGTSLPGKLK